MVITWEDHRNTGGLEKPRLQLEFDQNLRASLYCSPIVICEGRLCKDQCFILIVDSRDGSRTKVLELKVHLQPSSSPAQSSDGKIILEEL